MKQIEEIAISFITAYNSSAKEEIAKKKQSLLNEINKNEFQLSKITHYYTMARALYYLLQEDNNNLFLTDEGYGSIVRLIYYCLLQNYFINNEVKPSDVKYKDIIGGSELACIIICENPEFLTYRILTAALHYMPNYSQKHISNQLRLFGGIIKESKENNYYHTLDKNISDVINQMLQNEHLVLPVGEELKKLKSTSIPIIQDIIRNLEMGLKMEEYDSIW